MVSTGPLAKSASRASQRVASSAGASSSRLYAVGISISIAGRSISALRTLASRSATSGSSTARPGAKSANCTSGPPPNSEESSVKGEVTILMSRLTNIFQMIGPILNCGSSMVPLTGRSSRMLPSRSLSSATASFTGSLVASGLFTFSPSLSWETRILCCARSLRSSTR